MKIIEAMKQIKDLQRKADDLRKLVREHCAISSVETVKYHNQADKVSGWIQAHSDIVKRILDLRTAIQKTNLATRVTIEIDGKGVTKSIAEWIHRRRDLANMEKDMWRCLSDRGIVEGKAKGPSGDEMEIKIQRFYSPEKRDKFIDLYSSEPLLIDSRLEVINAITDLVD